MCTPTLLYRISTQTQVSEPYLFFTESMSLDSDALSP